MKNHNWKSYRYKAMQGKWKIVIFLEAGYVSLDQNALKDEFICLHNEIYFDNNLPSYPDNQTLMPQELDYFCIGLKLVSKQILKSLDPVSPILITLRSIHFLDTDIQDEAFCAAAIEWASEVFQFETPKVHVTFDDSKGKNGSYIYDFSKI